MPLQARGERSHRIGAIRNKVYPECQLDLIKDDQHGGTGMIGLSRPRTPRDLVPKIERLFELSAAKIRALEDRWTPSDGAPVFTIDGRYAARGWTEWTQGFEFGAAILQFDATGDREFLALGRSRTIERMASHLTHVGVHDHGFNNVSTYGALWRLAREGRIDASDWERALLRARAEGERRRAGASMDGHSRRRVHLFLQRRALALRRHDPVAASAGVRPSAGPSLVGRAGSTGRICSIG